MIFAAARGVGWVHVGSLSGAQSSRRGSGERMIEVSELPTLRDPIVIAAFEGWNDAAEAATTTIAHLAELWTAEPVAALDPEDYYDFQVNRPRVSFVDGVRHVTWPTTRILLARETSIGRDVLLVQGIEPSFRWRSFVVEILELARQVDATLVVCVGALLADVTHTRPLPVGIYNESATLPAGLEADTPSYEGPTGIVGVLADASQQAGLPTVSLWASVPHYAGGATSPKATLAILRRLEDVLDVALPYGDLPEMSKAWERGVDDLAASDDEVAQYVEALEQAQDTASHPAATGDAIAAEFERYLRRRDDPS